MWSWKNWWHRISISAWQRFLNWIFHHWNAFRKCANFIHKQNLTWMVDMELQPFKICGHSNWDMKSCDTLLIIEVKTKGKSTLMALRIGNKLGNLKATIHLFEVICWCFVCRPHHLPSIVDFIYVLCRLSDSHCLHQYS